MKVTLKFDEVNKNLLVNQSINQSINRKPFTFKEKINLK